VLRRVALIKVAQRLGIPLAEIGAALKSLPDNRAPTAADWKVLSAQWSRDLDQRIEQLTLLRDRGQIQNSGAAFAGKPRSYRTPQIL
jgi:MerR family redox-sensitive transcriptional activator SoxR